MRRVILIAFVLLLALTGCGSSADTNVGDPPQSQQLSESDSAKVNQVLNEWKASVPEVMKGHGIKPETIEQKTYSSTAKIEEVAAFYDELTKKGWTKSPRLSGGPKNGVLLTGYEAGGTTSLVVAAFSADQIGGKGLVIYTAKGHK
jgi:uncharacterized protein YcfL